MNIDLSQYLEEVSKRKTDTKAVDRFTELTLPYLKYIVWNNDTLDKDTRAFWASARRAYNRKIEPEYIKLLEWVKKKNCLTPYQVCGALNNTKKPSWVK